MYLLCVIGLLTLVSVVLPIGSDWMDILSHDTESQLLYTQGFVLRMDDSYENFVSHG